MQKNICNCANGTKGRGRCVGKGQDGLSLSLVDSISSFSSEMRIAFSLIRVIRPGYVTRKREGDGGAARHACMQRPERPHLLS